MERLLLSLLTCRKIHLVGFQHLKLFPGHIHHVMELSHQGLKLVDGCHGGVVGADVRSQDPGLDLGLRAVLCNVSGLLTIVTIAMGSDAVDLHGHLGQVQERGLGVGADNVQAALEP